MFCWLDQHAGNNMSLPSDGESELCSKCLDIDFSALFRTDDRDPDPDGDCLKSVNTLNNINEHKSCPFCRLLHQIISSSPKTRTEVYHRNDSEAIYLGPERCDYAMCGIEIEREHQASIASCLRVQAGGHVFQHCILLAPEDARSLPSRPWYSIVHRPSINVNFSTVGSWLDNCEASHGDVCKQTPIELEDEKFQVYQRAINVYERAIEHLDLRNTKFAALTYVWGAPTDWSASSLVHHPGRGDGKAKAQLSKNLPQTFEDALRVCRQLGIPFLWIDALCIDQSDEEDKRSQIQHMDFIYSSAYLTIAAVEGKDPTFGLPRVALNGALQEHEMYTYPERVGSQQLVIVPGFVVPSWKWNTRAWTLQESLLSRRLLVFNSYGVALYCQRSVCREDLSHIEEDSPSFGWKGIPRSVFTNEYYRSEFGMVRYARLITMAGSRALSDPTDSLNVISGMLRAWTRQSGVEFLSGLPSTHMSDSLIWQGSEYRSRGQSGLPTWSWAAYQGSLKLPLVVTEPKKNHVGRFQKPQPIDVADFMGPLPSRRVSFHDPDSLNFGTVIEHEAAIYTTGSNNTNLTITSYVARFHLPVFSKSTYEQLRQQFESYNETVLDANGKAHNSMALLEGPNGLSVHSSPHGYAGVKLDLPLDLSAADEAYLRNGEVTFLMLKHWHHLYEPESPSRRPWMVWALLLSAGDESSGASAVRRRLGCIMIPAQVWDLGSLLLETCVIA